MRLARLVGERLEPRNPFLKLFLRVVVAEAHARRVALRLPRLAVAAMEPDHRQVLRGRRRDRRDAGVETLRHVHTDVGEVAFLEEAEGLLDVAFLHPALMTELDRHAEVREPLDTLCDVRLGFLRDHEPLRELEEYGSHLADGRQRALAGELLPVDVAFAFGDRGLQVLVERVRPRRVVGQQGVGLDVEREVLRCALDPQDRVALRRGEVVRRVNLNQRELRRVELQAFLRRPRVGRVEVPVLDERLVGPRRGADQDRAGRHRGHLRTRAIRRCPSCGAPRPSPALPCAWPRSRDAAPTRTRSRGS